MNENDLEFVKAFEVNEIIVDFLSTFGGLLVQYFYVEFKIIVGF